MKKPHKCQLKITLDFQITHHGQEARTERTSLIKVSLKNGKSLKNTSKGLRNSCFVKVTANFLKVCKFTKNESSERYSKGFQKQLFASAL